MVLKSCTVNMRKDLEMTYRDYVYWLNGFAENISLAPTVDQWTVITDHLKICFNCEPPNFSSFLGSLDEDSAGGHQKGYYQKINPHMYGEVVLTGQEMWPLVEYTNAGSC